MARPTAAHDVGLVENRAEHRPGLSLMAVHALAGAGGRKPRLARGPLGQQAAHQGHTGVAVQLGELARPRTYRGRRAREAGDAAERGAAHQSAVILMRLVMPAGTAFRASRSRGVISTTKLPN